jgi:hypothetical protein
MNTNGNLDVNRMLAESRQREQAQAAAQQQLVLMLKSAMEQPMMVHDAKLSMCGVRQDDGDDGRVLMFALPTGARYDFRLSAADITVLRRVLEEAAVSVKAA